MSYTLRSGSGLGDSIGTGELEDLAVTLAKLASTAKPKKSYAMLWNGSHAAGTEYFPVIGTPANGTSTLGLFATVVTAAGTVKNARGRINGKSGNVATEDLTITLMLNGVATGIAFTTAGATAAPEVLGPHATEVAVVAGDRLEWRMAQAVGTVTYQYGLTFDIEAT